MFRMDRLEEKGGKGRGVIYMEALCMTDQAGPPSDKDG